MNQDNRRLQEIQREKQEYGIRVLASTSDKDKAHYYAKINELTREETEILKRADVKI